MNFEFFKISDRAICLNSQFETWHLFRIVAPFPTQLKLIARIQPVAKASADVPANWLRCLKLARPKIRSTGLSVHQFFRELVKFGGFLARKYYGEPDWQTI